MPLLLPWALRPIQSLNACTTVHFTILHVSAVRISHYQVLSHIQKQKYKGREAIIYSGTNYNNIAPNNTANVRIP